MGNGIKPLHLLGVAAVGAAVFGAGVVLMGGPWTQSAEPTAAVAANDEPAVADDPPAEEPPHDLPRAPAPRVAPRPDPAPVVKGPAAWNGKWDKPSGLGLPNPHRLSDNEKAALNLLGGATDTHTFSFSSETLDDGSTVPGVPPLSAQEVKDIVLGKIRAKGMGDGFEDAIRTLAVHNPGHLSVWVAQPRDWADLQKLLDKRELSKPETVYARVPGGRPIWYQIQGASYGWLAFGVESGKVRLVGANFGFGSNELVAAESIPGGRSAPDPSKAIKKPKPRPANAPPRQVDALQRLGNVVDVKVVPYPSTKRDAKFDALVKTADEAVGKPLHPDLIETARKVRDGQKVLELIVTTSRSIPVDELTDIMGGTRFIHDDTTTFPGTALKWYVYYWLEFGVADGQVKKVRVHCQMVPKSGP
jgi:hypothetical protein